MFKDGKAVAFDYHVELAFSDSLVWGERYQSLSELEILRLLWIAVPNARWVKIPSDSTIRRSRTRDSRVFAYYFASGNYKRHELLVHTAAVDAIFKKTDKTIRELRQNRSNHSMKPTAPSRNNLVVFATTPCRGLSQSR